MSSDDLPQPDLVFVRYETYDALPEMVARLPSGDLITFRLPVQSVLPIVDDLVRWAAAQR